MPKRSLYILPALTASIPLLGKDKPTFPKLIVSARYVLVTTRFGDDPADTRIMPDDRQAVADVQGAIQKWGRY